MTIAFYFLAFIIALFGLKFLFSGLNAFIMFFKVDRVSVRAKQLVIRDFIMGILFLVLAVAIIT